MTGCVATFEALDPEVQHILTYAGDVSDTQYRREGDRWEAYDPPASGHFREDITLVDDPAMDNTIDEDCQLLGRLHGESREQFGVNDDVPPPNGEDRSRKQKPPSRVIGAGTFMRSYEAISYTLDGILPSGSLYGLTARQGTGKTAWKIPVTIAVAMNRPDIIGIGVEPGRVAYVSIENPTDFKMKLAVNCFVHNVSYDEIEPRVAIIDGRDTPEQIYAGLKLDAERNGPFQLVCFDTFRRNYQIARTERGCVPPGVWPLVTWPRQTNEGRSSFFRFYGSVFYAQITQDVTRPLPHASATAERISQAVDNITIRFPGHGST